MKYCVFICLNLVVFSCNSKPSSVCNGIIENEMCFNFVTSELTIQHWKKSGSCFVLEFSNETSGAYYQKDLFLSVKLFDPDFDTIPKVGLYKGTSFVNPSVHTKQFEMDFYVNGMEDYKMDVASYPELRMNEIIGETLHGSLCAGMMNAHNVTDKPVLWVNFDNTWHL